MQQIEMPDVGSIDRKLLRSTYQILLVEDEDDAIQTVRDNLGVRGLTSIDVARDTADADGYVRGKRYDAILSDVLFDLMPPASKKQGDVWLLENANRFRGIFCAAVTGKGGLIHDRDGMTSAQIEIVVKGTNRELGLYDQLEQFADAKIELDKPRIQQSIIEGIVGHSKPPLDAISAAARDLFVEWLMQNAESTSKDIIIGQEYYSPRDLAEEVLRDTPVGAKMLLLFVGQMRKRLFVKGTLA